jgi:hypothetical protein
MSNAAYSYVADPSGENIRYFIKKALARSAEV